jgi:uncharacterized membrane protein YqjE
MRFDPRGWWRLLQSLGDAMVDLVHAEVAALRADLLSTSRRLGRGLGLVAIAAGLLFWAVGLLSLAAIEVVDLWWPRWAATLSVAGVFLVLVAIFARWGASVLRDLEPPGATVLRRWEDHQEWWNERILEGEEPSLSESSTQGRGKTSEISE